jgi:hypothetical protein
MSPVTPALSIAFINAAGVGAVVTWSGVPGAVSSSRIARLCW